MKAAIAYLLITLAPLWCWAQTTETPASDSSRIGTFVVRKVYLGGFLPEGLGFLGNMGGSGAAPQTITISGKLMRFYDGDTTPIRWASAFVGDIKTLTTDEGKFALKLPVPDATTDSVAVTIAYQTDWDTTITVPYATNSEEYVVVRDLSHLAPESTVSRKERRRERAKRILLPWVWFQKKEALPPKQPRKANNP